MHERIGAYRVLVGKPGERWPPGDACTDGQIILKRIFKQWDWGHGRDFSDSEYGQVAGSCGCCNNPSGSTQCGELLASLLPAASELNHNGRNCSLFDNFLHTDV
jgi:hypothetical protein